jgi:hypothetical protein
MSAASWGVMITLSIFVLSNIAALIYWSAKITTLLTVVQKELSELTDEFKLMKGTYVSKEDLAYRISTSDKEHSAMWKRIDQLAEVK